MQQKITNTSGQTKESMSRVEDKVKKILHSNIHKKKKIEGQRVSSVSKVTCHEA